MKKTEYFVYCGFFITHEWGERFVQIANGEFYTDIQLKTLRLSLEVFNRKINMRRDSVIYFIIVIGRKHVKPIDFSCRKSYNNIKNSWQSPKTVFGDLGRRFWLWKRYGKGGILCVMQLFHNA